MPYVSKPMKSTYGHQSEDAAPERLKRAYVSNVRELRISDAKLKAAGLRSS